MSIDARLTKLEEVHSGHCLCDGPYTCDVVDRTIDAEGGRQDAIARLCEKCGQLRRMIVVTDEHSPTCHPSQAGELFEGPIIWKE